MQFTGVFLGFQFMGNSAVTLYWPLYLLYDRRNKSHVIRSLAAGFREKQSTVHTFSMAVSEAADNMTSSGSERT
jgi:hypothetical protein